MDRYRKLERIGCGSYGIVYEGRDTKTDKTVAIKKVRVDDYDQGVSWATLREISLMKFLSHPNIMTLQEVIHVNDDLYIILKHFDQDLRKYLKNMEDGNKKMEDEQIRSYMYQLLKAIDYAHSHGVLHRDLKPDNLLVDKQGNLCVCDWGLARFYMRPHLKLSPIVVTLWYRAPEILLESPTYGKAIDIWSVGCIFAEMLTGKAFFQGDSQIGQLMNIFQHLGTPTEQTWPGFSKLPHYSVVFPYFPRKDWSTMIPRLKADDQKDALDLLNRLLEYSPSKRISAKEALTHPYFTSLVIKDSENILVEDNAKCALELPFASLSLTDSDDNF